MSNKFIPKDFINQIKAFQGIVGIENVIQNNDDNKIKVSTTFATNQKILGIIYPSNSKQIQECIKLANDYKIKIYPISTGKNIGFGGKVPTKDNCMIMDLSKMNKIIEFNETLSYITVEPGVTQQQVADFLSVNNSKLILSVTGSFKDSSIIGNCLERGNTSGPLVERAEHICNLGIVLPCGNYIKTGYGRFKNSKTKHIHKYGLGPDLSGLFIQSNLGIVTELTLWLSPAPDALEIMVFNTINQEQLIDTVNAIRSLKSNDVINEVFLWNDYKVSSIVQRYPFNLFTQTPLPQEWLDKFKNNYCVGTWNGSVILRSNSKLINWLRKYNIRNTLRKSTKAVIGSKDIKFMLIKLLKFPIEKLININLKLLFEIVKSPLFMGRPSNVSINSIYWRKKQIPDNRLVDQPTPEFDLVGFIWCDVVMPLIGEDIAKITENVKNIIIGYSFEPALGILCTNKRYVILVIGITYDRMVNGDDEKAMECHNSVFSYLEKHGYYPSRLGIQSMDKISNNCKSYNKVLKKLKLCLDPHDILSPGRYDFRNNWK